MNAGKTGLVWQRAVVVDLDGSCARVRFDRLQHCQQCLSGKGCGAGVFSRLFSRRSAQLRLEYSEGLEVGQAVRVGIEEAQLLRLAVLLYGLPLMAFILAAAATASLAANGWIQDLLSLGSGLLAAAGTICIANRLGWARMNPHLVALSSPAECEALESRLKKGHI